jgi:hypothetical protein
VGHVRHSDSVAGFGTHPDGLRPHDIQTPRCFEKKPETTETAGSDRDHDGPWRERGRSLSRRHSRNRVYTLDVIDRAPPNGALRRHMSDH